MPSSKGRVSNRHNWNNLEQYLSTHEGYIRHFQGRRFLLEDEVTYEITSQAVFWHGTLYCADGIKIDVTKTQEVRQQKGRLQVRTTSYSYHARRSVGNDTINLFRYDNAHPHDDHPDAHHAHHWDAEGGEACTHVGEARWPTFGDIFAEAEQWWETHVRAPQAPS